MTCELPDSSRAPAAWKACSNVCRPIENIRWILHRVKVVKEVSEELLGKQRLAMQQLATTGDVIDSVDESDSPDESDSTDESDSADESDSSDNFEWVEESPAQQAAKAAQQDCTTVVEGFRTFWEDLSAQDIQYVYACPSVFETKPLSPTLEPVLIQY
jgi:hypothetical protein